MRIWCDEIFELVVLFFSFSSLFISLCSHRVAISCEEMPAFCVFEDSLAFLGLTSQ